MSPSLLPSPVRLITEWAHGYERTVREVRGDSVAEMMLTLYPDMSAKNLTRVEEDFSASLSYSGAIMAGYAWSWNFIVAIDDPRPADEIVRAALKSWEIADEAKRMLEREGLWSPPGEGVATSN